MGRQCFKQDEDSHWYLINTADEELFEKLLYDSNDEYAAFEEKFGTKRLNMHISNYSFVDCQKIQCST